MILPDLHGQKRKLNRRRVLMLGAAGGFAAFGPSPRSFAKDEKVRMEVKYSMIRESVSVQAKFETFKTASLATAETKGGDEFRLKGMAR